MSKNTKPTSTPNITLNLQSKDKQILDQLQKVFNEFYKKPQSMKMVSVKLKIDRGNICWFCREFRLNNKLGIAKRGFCKITKRLVNYYTTNPDLIPINPQTKLF